MTKDMTNGSPMKLILGFSVPMFFGMLFQQFYNLVDTLIVGQFLGVDALAAVGSTGSINFMIIGFCMGVCSGFAIPLSHRFGEGDYPALRGYMMNAVYVSAAFAVVMTALTVLFCRPVLKLMQTPDNIIDDAYTYIVIIFAGIPAIYLYNLISGIIRSMGDSRTPVVFLTIAALLNIGLDLLLIIVCGMGVAGAALATVVSQLLSGLGCVVYSLRHFEILHVRSDERRVNRGYIRVLLGMGVPMGLQYSITAIGSVVLQSAVNTLGSDAVASMTAAGKISMFFSTPYDAMGTTMATYGGQNVGARKLKRVREGLRACSLLGIVYSLAALVVLYFAGEWLVRFFVESASTGVIRDAHQLLIINGFFFIPLAFVNIVRFLIQGMGYSRFAVFAGVSEMVARALVGFVLVPRFGFTAACFAGPVAWVFADAFLFPAYVHVYRKTEQAQRLRAGGIA